MNTKINFLLIILFTLIVSMAKAQKSFYELKAKTTEGNEYSFSKLKGKKVLIVNTASKCGYTPQFKDLEQLYKTYKDDNFVILGFPSNDFFHQDPGTNLEIREFCSKNYGVTFQIMEKISVKGKDMDAVYQWLTKKENNGKMDSDVKWNFQKYLIDSNGSLIDIAYSSESPNCEKIITWLKKK